MNSCPILPSEIIEYILGLVSSKTRAEVCSVSILFNQLSVKISSRKWPVYVDVDSSNCGSFRSWYIKTKFKEVYSLSKQIISDYHLLVRVNNISLLNLELAYRTGDDDIIDLVRGKLYAVYSGECWLEQIRGTCRIGRVDLIKQLMEVRNGRYRSNDALESICRSGNLSLLQWFLREYPRCNIDSRCILTACRSGNLELIKYVISIAIWFSPENFVGSVCRGGHMHVLEYFIKEYPLTGHMLFPGLPIACEKGHMKIIRYLVTLGATSSSYDGLIAACRYGRLKVVKYLTANLKYPTYCNAYTIACKYCHQDIMEYLRSVGLVTIRVNTNAFYAACRNGNLDIVKYILTDPIYGDNYGKGIKLAYKNKHYRVVNWLYYNYNTHNKYTHKIVTRLIRGGFITSKILS